MTKKPDDLDAVRTIADTLADFDPGDQERIIRWAKERVGLPVGGPRVLERTPSRPTASAAEPTATPADAEPDDTPADIKSFVGEKRPSSDTEFAAAVAYYYRFEAPVPDRKDAITKEDLLEACRLVGRGRPARPAQTLVNAHRAGVLDKAERGQYAINTVGENLVAITLPTSESAKATPRRKSSSRKKSAAGATAAKKKRTKKRSSGKKPAGTARKKKSS